MCIRDRDKVDEVTLDAMTRSLELDVEIHDSGLWKRNLDVIASPAQGIREIFDLSPTATIGDWENLTKRLNAVPGAVDGYIRTLREGIAAKDTPARRQVEWVLREVKELAGKDSFFIKFAGGAKAGDDELDSSLKTEVEKAGQHAAEGYGKLAAFLESELLPNANTVDAIGRERYALLSRKFLGAKVDLDETYEWGIEELARVTAEQNDCLLYTSDAADD